ncbi:homeobox-leucine zipper protein HDG2 [Striga asiatica]|uniref:Homeobox-leucine zipper protein HDG2 n=1 Tax=Striga asiatica TaxID=4170 RepID=A0A5A7QSG1_STRAF|nr:homeobox-leucine zipper protein HDG2 [Striga asiatica]
MFHPNIFDSHHHLLDMAHNKDQENETDLIRDDELYGPEAQSGDDQDPAQIRPNKKKRYHRHTQHQIQEMESFFKECPHPDDKQRKDLGRRLGLEPLQVKFWFQNKRTQMKNDKLRAENVRYKEALSCATCPNCGGPAAIGEMSFDEQHLRIENVRLREEIGRISGMAAKYVGKSMQLYPHLSPGSSSRSLDIGVENNFGPQSGMTGEIGVVDLLRSVSGPSEAEKPVIIELAVAAMEELIRMAQSGEPLWIPTIDHNSLEALNEEEYVRVFPRGIGPKPLGFKSEASRESAIVIMNHMNLVEIFMDVNRWSSMFSCIVSRATTLEVLSTGMAGNYDGALQVMNAEFQVPSPLVPTRENYFVRYCKQHGDGTTWAVVDVSLDNIRPNSISRCRKRPSGCLIQELPDGYSKVTWVEHVEVDDRAVHNIYKPLISSGTAFGARRWVATLDRQCERLARSGPDDVRVMTRKSMDDPGRPPGIVLSAATSFWLPVPPKRVFDFLRDENSRSESANSSQSNMLILQESCVDPTGSYVIYAPVDIIAMNAVLSGGDPDYVALLPSGFAILPDGPGGGPSTGSEVGSGGSLLTVAFQILVDSVPTAKLSLGSVATVNSLIKCTVERIKGAVLCEAS